MKHILILDDSETVTAMYETLLSDNHTDFTSVHSLGDAFDTLAHADRAFDLAIIDQNLDTTLNGIDFIKCIRKTQLHRDTPIIMISQNPSDLLKAQCEEFGVQHCFTKSLTEADVLKQAIEQMLSTGRAA